MPGCLSSIIAKDPSDANVAGFSDGVVTTPVGGYGLVSPKGR